MSKKNIRRSWLNLIFGVYLLLCFSSDARASEGMFGYLYTAETTPGGNWEYEQTQTLRSGKARGQYTAVDIRNEFEYGITSTLQSALYINSSYLNILDQYDPEDVSKNLPNRSEFNVNGVSVELLYRLLSPYKDGLGLAFYLEPEISLRDRMTGDDKSERALEGRIILQKNFLDDTLITVTNFMIEPEWERDEGATVRELWVEWTVGANYRLRKNWFIGLEFRDHMEFPNMNLHNKEHSAYFLGPTLHYGGEKYWWTLTALPQIVGRPRDLGVGADGKRITNSYAHLGQHEKFEIRLRFGIPFGGGHSHEHEDD